MIPTTTTKPAIHEKNRVEYWETLLGSKAKIGRVLRISPSAVTNWANRNCVPDRELFFLRLYVGEITLADWEDSVES